MLLAGDMNDPGVGLKTRSFGDGGGKVLLSGDKGFSGLAQFDDPFLSQ